MKFLAVAFCNLCVFLSVHVTALQSSEFYVSTSTGSDDYSGGSREKPWATIKYALSRVSGSESNPAKIYVAEGTYYEYEISMKPYVSAYGGYDPVSWSRDIGKYQTIVDGSGGGPDIFNGKDNSTIDGFTIQNGNEDGVDADTYSPTISNCIIMNCSVGGVRTDNGGRVVVKNILFNNVYGIYAETNVGETPIIENNLIIGSVHYGIHAANMQIINNTIDRSGSDGIYVGTIVPSPSILIQNNNITRCQSDGIYVSDSINAAGIVIKYNNVCSSGGDDYRGQAKPGEGSISKDPKYIKPLPTSGSSTDYDYHLSSASPSRDKGTDEDAPEDDLDGNPRPAGSKTDIGCYEYQSPPPTPTPTPYPPLAVSVNSSSPSVGGPLRVDVTVPPCNQAFDAWGVIMGQGAVYSFMLGNPASVKKGAFPIIKGVSRLPYVYQGCLCNMPAIPSGAEGRYNVIVGLVPAGVRPRGISDTIPGYADQKQIDIGAE